MLLHLALSTDTPAAALELRQAQPLGEGSNMVGVEVKKAGASRSTGALADPDESAQRLQFAFGVPWDGVVAFADVVRELNDMNA